MDTGCPWLRCNGSHTRISQDNERGFTVDPPGAYGKRRLTPTMLRLLDAIVMYPAFNSMSTDSRPICHPSICRPRHDADSSIHEGSCAGLLCHLRGRHTPELIAPDRRIDTSEMAPYIVAIQAGMSFARWPFILGWNSASPSCGGTASRIWRRQKRG